MAVYSKGRMITKDISKSLKLASLSKESLILFLMLLPHFDSHGKMNGETHYIKGEVVPLLPFFDVKNIEKCLLEIDKKTSVKWFKHNGLYYIQSINWGAHQKLDQNKVGRDLLPTYSGVTPELVHRKVEVEDEVEGKSKTPPLVARFLMFYNKYPKKQGKEDALKAFKSLSPSDDLLETMISAAGAQAKSEAWIKDGGKFIPLPATWIRGKRWEDEISRPAHPAFKPLSL